MLDEIKETLSNLIKSRTFVLVVVFVALFGILLQRVFYLQIVKGGDYQDSFTLKTEREVSVASTRGKIYDRNGEVLAYSELSYSVTIQDNGTYANTRTKNAKLNETIYKLIKLIEKNGDSVVSDLGIVYNHGQFEYSLEGNSLLRLKADVYGKNKISELEPKQELATADELMAYMCGEKKYDIRSSYTEEEQQKYGISVAGYTPEEQLQIATIRFGISANNYKRYVATTLATDVSEETVAAVLEDQSELQGAEIEESSRRVYPDSEYFAPIIGYIGKASQDELDSLQEENPDYELNDIVGKSGIEQYMETELQGTKGYEKMYVDSVGRILEVAEQKDAVPGNDVYLTIDKNLQMACYNILEQKLAGLPATVAPKPQTDNVPQGQSPTPAVTQSASAGLPRGENGLLTWEAVEALAQVQTPGAQITELQLDEDDGKLIYEVKYRDSNWFEYEMDLDAVSGEILKWERE